MYGREWMVGSRNYTHSLLWVFTQAFGLELFLWAFKYCYEIWLYFITWWRGMCFKQKCSKSNKWRKSSLVFVSLRAVVIGLLSGFTAAWKSWCLEFKLLHINILLMKPLMNIAQVVWSLNVWQLLQVRLYWLCILWYKALTIKCWQYIFTPIKKSCVLVSMLIWSSYNYIFPNGPLYESHHTMGNYALKEVQEKVCNNFT